MAGAVTHLLSAERPALADDRFDHERCSDGVIGLATPRSRESPAPGDRSATISIVCSLLTGCRLPGEAVTTVA
jgi:hypothetical protein